MFTIKVIILYMVTTDLATFGFQNSELFTQQTLNVSGRRVVGYDVKKP